MMMDIVENMVTSVIPIGSSLQTYQHYIPAVKFLHWKLIIQNIVEDADKKVTIAKLLNISQRYDETLFSSWTVEGPLLVHATNKYVQNPVKYRLFHAPWF